MEAQELQLYLVGGWGKQGKQAAESTLKSLHALPGRRLNVALACVGRLNKHPDTGDVLQRDLAVDTATLVAHPGSAQVPPFP